MSLPEPSFIDRDPAAITAEMVAWYEAQTGKTLYPAQVERILIDLISYRESLLRIGIQEAAKQNLVQYARYPMLDYLGELVGVYRLDTRAAVTTLRVTLDAASETGTVIPKGTVVATTDGGVTFATDANLLIAAGATSGDIRATATVTGATANGYLVGAVNTMVPAIDGVGVVNVTASSGGADVESDERMRERIKEAPEGYTNAGSRGAYRFWAMTAHQDIVDVAVRSPVPGTVLLQPLTIDGSPSMAIIEAVHATCNAEAIRPLCDTVTVAAPARVDFHLTAQVTIYNWAEPETVRISVLEQLNTHVSGLRSKLGADIVRAQFVARINGVHGVYNTIVTEPAEDRVLDAASWANCLGISIGIAGAVDG